MHGSLRRRRNECRRREQRVARMYEEAFSRPPTAQELAEATAFVAQQPDASRAWADLAHVLMNVKEFIFLN